MKKTLLILFLLLFHGGPLQANDQILSLDDVTLHYEMRGKGPAVVLIHGWGVDLESWHFLFPDLADNYTVIRYDRRGYGKSDRSPDVSLDPIDLCNLLDTLKIEQAVIIGHSQGGEVALRFALSFPERTRGLVLFGSVAPDGFGLPWNGPDALPAEMAQTAREKGLDAFRAMFAGHPLGNGFIEDTKGLEIMVKMFHDYEARDLLDPKPSANATPRPHMERLTEISVPTLVITGDLEMPYFQIVSDALAYGISNAERVVVNGGGHSVMLQQPERFNAEINRFLAKVLP